MKNKYTWLVELVVNPSSSTSQRLQFVDQPYLRGEFIFGLEVYTINDIATSPQGNAVIDETVMEKSFLTLYTTDPDMGGIASEPNSMQGRGPGEYIQLLPLSDLHYLQNSNNDPFKRWPFELNGQSVLWEKSYITLSSGVGNTSANASFLINVSFGHNPKNNTN